MTFTMRLTLINLTDRSLLCNYDRQDASEHHIMPPSLATTVKVPKRLPKLTITAHQSIGIKDDIWLSSCTFYVKTSSSSPWGMVSVDEACPWRIYRFRVSCKHTKLLIIPRRNLHSFLAEMPDSASLSSLLLPGTHDTLAFYGWPVAQCQSPTTPLAAQLKSGIRVLDIRLAVKDSGLISYHGAYPQRTSFQEILSTINSFFLDSSSCQETIVMSIKQEDFSVTPTPIFSQLVHEEIHNGPGGKQMWFLENRIPLLGEVRGKVVMFSRFGGDGSGWEDGLEGLGIHPTNWPDSAKYGFEWDCKEVVVKTHDWYAIPSFLAIPEKVSLSTQNLLLPSVEPSIPTLSISYFSAASFPFALPTIVARGFGWPSAGFGVEGVNSRVGTWLFDMLSSGSVMKKGEMAPRIRGWTFLDFYEEPEDQGIVPLLVECNFR